MLNIKRWSLVVLACLTGLVIGREISHTIKSSGILHTVHASSINQQFACNLSSPVVFTAASGSVQVVPLASGQTIRVCHVSVSASTATNFTLQYGTGSACGAGTNALSGAYNNVTTLALDFNGTLRTPAAQELCINSLATITAGGIVTYAQF